MGTSLRIAPPSDGGRRGNRRLGAQRVDAALDGTEIDGLQTRVVDAAAECSAAIDVGASGLDHVVVMTTDLERTTGASSARDRVRAEADARGRRDASGFPSASVGAG